MSILGNRVQRTGDPRLLTVGGRYTADVDDPSLDGAVHAVYVRSMVAHGTIEGIEVDEARSAPGVLGVFTAADLDLPPMPLAVPLLDPRHARPALVADRVRFVGEPLAVVVAESVAAAIDAAELVWADIEPLPAVLDAEHALAGETLLFEEVRRCSSRR